MAVSIDQSKTGILGVPFLGRFAYASLPPAANWNGYQAFATDLGANGSMVRSNGTRWLLLMGQQVLKGLGAAVTGIANVEQIVLQTLLPVNALQTNDTLRFWINEIKSGTTDTGIVRVRLGTAGTTADTLIANFAALSAAVRGVSLLFDFKLTGGTAIQRVGSTANGYGTVNTGVASSVAITDASANALYVSVSILSGEATDTVAIESGQIQLITP